MVERTLSIVLAALAVALSPVLAQAQAMQPQQQRVPAPERNVETGLAFPDVMGPARKVASTDYGKTLGTPTLGYAWNYETQVLTTTFYVYNFGIAPIPSGAAGVVLQQFQQAQSDIDQAVKAGRYDQLKPSQGPSNCTVGTMVFRCISYSAIRPTDKRPVFTRLFVTGYRNYFLKIRQDWPQDAAGGGRDADAVVQALASSAKP
jgi:hypothetical protein